MSLIAKGVVLLVGAAALGHSSAQAQTAAPKDTPSGPAMAAEELDPETRVLAREFAIRGAEAFDAGDYETALENFNRATSMLDVPSIAVMQARTLVKLGRWLEGLDRFQQTARLHLPPNAPQPYRDAVGQAAAEGEALRTQIPQIALLLSPASPSTAAQVEVRFDDKVVPRALLDILRPVDPGEHHVRASHDGKVFFERTLQLAPLQQVQVLIPAASPVPVAPPPRVDLLADDVPPRETSAAPNWPLYGALGVAGLGLVGATVTGISASGHKATLEDVCDPQTKVCPREYRGEISALHTSRTLFYLSGGLTLLGAGVAAYLWLSETPDASVAFRLSPTDASLVARY